MTFTGEGYNSLVKSLPYDSYTTIYLVAKFTNNEYHLGYSVGFLDFKNKNKNKHLENMPYFLGESDINRQLQMLPGIEQGGEGYSNLYVRGGDVDQNLITYNGTPIYNSNHLFGISSVFHNRSIHNTAVHRGITSAKYGGRTSSFINLESKKNDKYSGSAGEFEMTPLNAGFYYEIINKDNSYFTLSARRSWVDLLLPVETRQNSLNFNMHDIQATMGKKLKNDGKLEFSLMNTRDLFFVGIQGDTSSANLGLHQKWSNLLGSVKYSHNYSSKLSASHKLAYSNYRSGFDIKITLLDSLVRGAFPTVTQTLTRSIQDILLHSDWVYQHSNSQRISYGVQSNTRLFLLGKYEYVAENFAQEPDEEFVGGQNKRSVSEELSLYAEDNIRLNDNAILDLGVRTVFYNYQDYTTAAFEPRLHFTSYLKNNDVFKFGYNRHNQFVGEINTGSTGSPDNYWVPATGNILPEKADIFEIGYEKKLGKSYAANANIYLKSMKNVSQVSDISDAVDYTLDWQNSVVLGTGNSSGIELMFQKHQGIFTGWVSYAYSTSTRQFDDVSEDAFLFTYDRPHMLKVYMNFTDESLPWVVGMNIVVGSGQLFTLPIGKYRDVAGNTVLEYNSLNNYRSPMYKRVDVSLIRKKDNYGIDQEWRFYLYNALGSINPINVNPDFEDNSYTNLTVSRNYLAFLPGVAYIVKF